VAVHGAGEELQPHLAAAGLAADRLAAVRAQVAAGGRGRLLPGELLFEQLAVGGPLLAAAEIAQAPFELVAVEKHRFIGFQFSVFSFQH
jgi:hypothetical protein